MIRQSEAISLILNELKKLGLNIVLAPLPQNGGVTAEITGSEPKGRRLDISHGAEDITVLFLSKFTDQQEAYETLCRIGNFLDSYKGAVAETVQITSAGIRSGASLVSNDGGYYVYSMIARISINF